MNSNVELKERISNWLNDQGYPLEMYVASMFQADGFSVKQSSYYTDYESDKSREIDVTAQKTSGVYSPINVEVSFHIECKSKNKPWLLLTSNIPHELGYGFEDILSSNMFHGLFAGQAEEGFDPKIIRQLRRLPIYQTAKLSHGITEAFNDGADIPYSAIMSAVKSAVHRIGLINKNFNPYTDRYIGGVAFPIVIVDGKLFECSYSVDGFQTIEEVNNGLLKWNYPTPLLTQPLIRIITKESLKKWTAILMQTAQVFLEIHESNIDILKTIGDELNTRPGFSIG